MTPRAGRVLFTRFLILSGIVLPLLVIVGEPARGILYLLYAVTAIGLVISRSLSFRGDVRLAVLLMIGAGMSTTIGALVGSIADGAGIQLAFPSVADLFPLLSYLLFIAAILLIVRRRNPRLGLDPVLDSLVAGISAAVAQWTIVVVPFLSNPDNGSSARAGVVVFSTMSLLLVVLAIMALVAGSVPSTSNRLLAAGLVMTFTVDVTATLSADGRIPDWSVVVGSVAVLLLGGAGLLHPTVEQLLQRSGHEIGRLSRRRVTVLAFALITPPVLLLSQVATGGSDIQVLLPALGSVVLAPLVLIRLGRLVGQNERLAAQEGALRVVGEQLVEAETDADVADILEGGSQELIGGALLDTGLVMAPFDQDSSGWTAELAPALRAIEAEIQSFDHPTSGDLHLLDSVGVEGDWHAGLLVLQGRLWAVLILGVDQRLGDDQRNAITALCRQGAIAIRAVRRTEEQVRERAEQRFGTLIENSSDIVTILDENNVLVYTSPVSKRLLGIEPEPGFEFRISQLVHREDQAKAQRLLDTVRETGHATDEFRLQHINGTYLWFEVQATNLFDDPDVAGVLINARAVDDRKAAEELLLLSEARFKSLVQNNSDLVMVVDAHERVNYASPSAESMVGESPEVLFGRALSGVFTAADIDWNAKLREAAKDGKTFEFGFAHSSADWLTFEAMVTDLRDEPAVGGFVLNARDITERKTMMGHLRHQATHDTLTGMPNRVLVIEELDQMLAHNPGNSSVAAICIDLDDFRDINDSLGQSVGDEVLIAVSDRIRSTLSFGDQAARIGADEFAVIVERAHGEEAVLEMTVLILDELAKPFHFEDRELSLSASAGMAVDHTREVLAEGLLRSSITAMHQAKREGRGRVARFENSMRDASSDRLELRGDLARAIGTDQLVVNYQPIVNLGTGEIIGAEALVRWDHPERGRLSPALFIPIAEDSGLIDKLDAQVRAQALADLASWRSQIPAAGDLTVSVNLSVGELYADDLVESVLRDLRLSDLPAEALVLEVTESHLLDDSDTVRTQMESLRSHGIRLAVDDFGTGYSSLGYIDRFEFDILKIDRSFVAGLANETNRRIVVAVLDLAAQLDARVVAEGIESASQEEELIEMGCAVGQGYLYSRPVAAAHFRRLLTGVAAVGA